MRSSMLTPSNSSMRKARRLARALALAGLLASLAPAAATAAIVHFGSSLKAPATLNTAEDLAYLGTYTSVPKAPDAPDGVFHTFHYGADTALWNVKLADGTARSPATGQALAVDLEGCARAAPAGPPPLTQIHFQDISPLPGGGAQVKLTSQAFAIPICAGHRASGATITTYRPINLCVSKGDYIAFNDEGGYVENVYRSGVPYRVLGRAHGSTSDSFLRDNGTGNGAVLSPSLRAANEGFVANRGEELMLRVRLGTGSNATHICPGGTSRRD
jgi:hypothetical protein